MSMSVETDRDDEQHERDDQHDHERLCAHAPEHSESRLNAA